MIQTAPKEMLNENCSRREGQTMTGLVKKMDAQGFGIIELPFPKLRDYSINNGVQL